MKRHIKALIVCLLIGTFAISGCESQQKEQVEFIPKLDTEEKIVLSTTGFFGNFEALDQITNDFNKYYPNVEFSYEQIGGSTFKSYIDANPRVDIMMTSEEVFYKFGDEVENICVDLQKENIDLSKIDDEMLKAFKHGDKLSAIPIGQKIYGMVVNVSLLKKEGLSVPTNYSEFVNVLTTLKSKGYTPVQGPNTKICAELTNSMLYDMILSDEQLYNDLVSGGEDTEEDTVENTEEDTEEDTVESTADKLQPVFDKLQNMVDNGFIDMQVNQNYPDDNYDQAILNFFEGDVPFWVCDTECVSGMKKRESKSQAFTDNPFEYEFMYVPMGEKGPYVYSEPWYGFSINKNGENYDYAVEFMRFLVTKDEINKLADIKGIPSVAKEKSDVDIYKNVLNPDKIEMKYVNEGKINTSIEEKWYDCMSKYAGGEFKDSKEASESFIKSCRE